MSDTPDKKTDRSILPLPEPQHPAITEIDARKATPPPRFELKPPKGAGAPNVVFILSGKMPGAGGRGDVFVNGEQVASGRIDRTIPFFTGTETADVGMDDLTPVTHDYKAYDNKFTGAIRKIVIGVGPVGEAFDLPLEWNGVG